MFLTVFLCILFLISLGNGFNYCERDKHHVLCNTNTFKANRGSRGCLKKMETFHFSGEVEAAILETFNYYREKAARGKIPNGKGFELGSPSANMMKMKWDEELAYMATKLSRLCKPYSFCKGCLDLERFPSTYVQSFKYVKYTRRTPFDWQSYIESIIVNNDDSNRGSNKAKPLDVLIWAEIYLVGCGLSISTIEDRTVHNFVCTFGPVVPEDDEEPSVEGTPCSYCPLGSECLSDLDVLCDCETPCYPFKYEDLKRMRRQAGNETKAGGAPTAEKEKGEGNATTAKEEESTPGVETDAYSDAADKETEAYVGEDVSHTEPEYSNTEAPPVVGEIAPNANLQPAPPAPEIDASADESGSSRAISMIFISQLFCAFSVTKLLK